MEIKKTDQGKNKAGFYYKYEISKNDADGKPLSELSIKTAIREYLGEIPVRITKRSLTGYYEARIGSEYRHIFAPVLN